jgi:hypothetical protein
MKAGDLIFVRTKGVLPTLIRFFDKGRFSHVAIAYSETQILEVDFDTSVRIVENPYDDIEVVSIPLKDITLLETFGKKYIGKKYDYAQIFRIWLRLVFGFKWLNRFNNPREVICSELAGEYLITIGLAYKGEELLAPNELYKDIKHKGY